MPIIPQSKFGNCSQCGDTDVACVKVGKELFCRGKCHKNNKTLQQLEKSKQKQSLQIGLRKLGNSNDNIELAQTVVSANAELERWFKERREEMTGICQHCGSKTSKNDDKYYKFSIAHLFQKAYFKSVKTHPDNWIELCHFNKSCHTNFDNSMIDIIDLNCFDIVIEKFVKMYPCIAVDERRRIPAVLLEYLKIDSDG